MSWNIKVTEVTPIDKANSIRVRFEVTNSDIADLRYVDETIFPASTSYDEMKATIVGMTKDFIKRFNEVLKVKAQMENNTFTGVVNDDGSVTLTDQDGNVY